MNDSEPIASAVPEEGAGAVRLNDMLCGCQSPAFFGDGWALPWQLQRLRPPSTPGSDGPPATNVAATLGSKVEGRVHCNHPAKAARLPPGRTVVGKGPAADAEW